MASTSTSTFTCRKCKVNDLSENDFTRCSLCKSSTHYKCNESFSSNGIYAENAQNFIKVGFKFFCGVCAAQFDQWVPLLGDIKSMLNALNTKIDSFESKVTDLDNKVTNNHDFVCEKFASMENSSSRLKNNDENSFASVLKRKSVVVLSTKNKQLQNDQIREKDY